MNSYFIRTHHSGEKPAVIGPSSETEVSVAGSKLGMVGEGGAPDDTCGGANEIKILV